MAEQAPRRSRRFAAVALVAVGIVAGLLAVWLLFASFTSYGVDCGTILSPKDPPPNSNPLSGCGGDAAGRTVAVVVGSLVAVACIVGGLLLHRRDRAAAPPTGDPTPS